MGVTMPSGYTLADHLLTVSLMISYWINEVTDTDGTLAPDSQEYPKVWWVTGGLALGCCADRTAPNGNHNSG